MGMYRMAILEVETAEFPVSACGLWVRDGLDGVEVWIDDKRISIPGSVLWDLVAEDYKRRQISRLEEMDTSAVRMELGLDPTL